MWSECKNCGTPVVLNPEKEEEIITASGVEMEKIDETCVLLLSHCPTCVNMMHEGPADAVIAKIKDVSSQPVDRVKS